MNHNGVVVALIVVMASASAACAQKVHNTYGSPLDTIKNTRLTTDVPTAKDFVRDTSPNKKDLDYTPLNGVDPQRPKPRDPAGVEALAAQLQSAGVRNADRSRGVTVRRTNPAPKRRAVSATR